ncbi:M48 family metallopeptidase, partial [Candidatus Woesearchaeota archaeon]|nr:M48 family metallopeptidase [Candidatus Woesearchaeota archaeon]
FTIIWCLISYYTGDKIVLKLSRARPLEKGEFPHLWHVIDGLAVAAGIPKPKAYVIEDNAINAFATGRDPEHASVAVTTGAVQKLDRDELEGVVAHELSHIKNYDIRTMLLAAVLVGVVAMLSDFMLRSFFWGRGNRDREGGGSLQLIGLAIGFVMALLAPLIANLIKMAISRKREYLADASGAMLTRYPQGLADALRKIANDNTQIKGASNATAHLYISNPFKKKGFVSNLFSTHPPIEDRIKVLEAM